MKFSVSLSSTWWPANIQKVDILFDLAKQHQSESKLLSACATVILAATLEQAISSKLDCAALSADEEGGSSMPYKYLQGKSLRDRVRELPGCLTNGEMGFAGGSPRARELNKLISYRNWLLHLEERPVTVSEADPRVTTRLDDGEPIIDISGLLPKDPWDLVTLNDASKFKEAVKVYMSEVIEPEQIGPGELVKRT
jgi:hypothetical protein